MGRPPNGIMNQQGMHQHMMGQQPSAPGLAGMMLPQSSGQAVSIDMPLFSDGHFRRHARMPQHHRRQVTRQKTYVAKRTGQQGVP